jgi:hypothetical protein
MPPADPLLLRASVSAHAPPTPLNVTEQDKVAPLEEIVFPVVVALNVMAPAALHVVVPDRLNEPLTASVPVLVNVMVVPVLVKLLQVKAPVNVTV